MKGCLPDLIKASRLDAVAWVDKFIFAPLIYQAYFFVRTLRFFLTPAWG